MKRIVFCFDGTWNRLDGEYPTNVARVAQALRHDAAGVRQIVHYDEGVGTDPISRIIGGAFGYGLGANIAEAYHFLVLNYEPGDQLFVFGFSRGAYTARSFVGLLRNAGIISRWKLREIAAAIALYRDRRPDAAPSGERACQFRYEHCPQLLLPGDRAWRASKYPGWAAAGAVDLAVRYLGVWDTVGALGVPGHIRLLAPWVNRRYRFHDQALSSFVEAARHAVAADERRRTFEPSLWSNLDDLNGASADPAYQQLVFPGVHGAVGGGGPVRGLSDGALDWIVRGARGQGLLFDPDPRSPLYALRPDPRAQLFNATGKTGWSWRDWATGLGLADRAFAGLDHFALHPSLKRRFAAAPGELPERRAYRPPSLRHIWDDIAAAAEHEYAAPGEPIDERELRAPARVEPYDVQPGDTLSGIAVKQMGAATDWPILFHHNRQAGKLHDPHELFAGQRIEIPVYEDAPAGSPNERPPLAGG